MMKGFPFFLLVAAAAQAAELPVWFDAFQAPRESRAGWQTFRAAYALGFAEDPAWTGGRAMKAKVRFEPGTAEAILIWRFPDVQMRRFRLRALLPREVGDAPVYLRMVSNDTKGDAAFFRPFRVGDGSFDLPIPTAEGLKTQKASPLPVGRWVDYEVAMPDDVFHEQQRRRAGHAVQDFALMNMARDGLKLGAGSRPATEAFFISFVVPDDSPLFGRELEILVDLAEIY